MTDVVMVNLAYLDDLTARAERAEAAIQRVREIHRQDDGYCRDGTYCAECVEPWPCPTVAALEASGGG